MPTFDLELKRLRINIFKLGGAYYFKNFFDDLELFKALEPYYEKQRYRFRMATAGERNKVMKSLDKKDYDPNLIEDPAPLTMEISRCQKYGELLKNSVESYPLRDKIVLVMMDLVWVEHSVAMGAVVSGHVRDQDNSLIQNAFKVMLTSSFSFVKDIMGDVDPHTAVYQIFMKDTIYDRSFLLVNDPNLKKYLLYRQHGSLSLDGRERIDVIDMKF